MQRLRTESDGDGSGPSGLASPSVIVAPHADLHPEQSSEANFPTKETPRVSDDNDNDDDDDDFVLPSKRP
ncbi:hypothetical protein HZH68_000598 [Vespula germanica]|uniref:Uncharacterized protein n=1 Tax=Vespula germanica TaxID=30212 RepID=A0A834U660_VESGE|nr:hypothetical protein HZH68_000598 [Vespula germanica]